MVLNRLLILVIEFVVMMGRVCRKVYPVETFACEGERKHLGLHRFPLPFLSE